MCMPSPGRTTLATTSPMTSATVVSVRKYANARSPTLPRRLRSPMPAMPATTVQKMIGAMIILMSLMKPSPSGWSAMPHCGFSQPMKIPNAIATTTCR